MSSPVGATLDIVTYTNKHGKVTKYRYWKARIMVDGRNTQLGRYKTKQEAVDIYQAAKRLRPKGLVHVLGLVDR